ncbi:BrnA antitoxin family protein [Pelagibacterium limicola]|uniref:BrnA antitoxin family protein n=1 Tax=Pelagibacterium limicola TaxID=2791022 RepID=UPI0018AFDAA5|nr:BrnA antitoxin family protein [Pelagibacterium limicola]
MAHTPRRPTSAIDRAEALFKAATTKPAEVKPKGNAIPKGKELVSIRIDRDVLEHFQDDGPGWQERINDALRAAAGLEETDI